MDCSDTGSLPAIHCDNLDTGTVGTINDIVGMFKKLFKGNGRITLNVSGGHVEEIETMTKTPNKRRKKIA